MYSKVKKVIHLEKGLTGGSKLGIDSSSEVSHLSLDAVELPGLAELELHTSTVSWTTFLGKTNVVLVVFLLLDLCTLMVKLARKWELRVKSAFVEFKSWEISFKSESLSAPPALSWPVCSTFLITDFLSFSSTVNAKSRAGLLFFFNTDE